MRNDSLVNGGLIGFGLGFIFASLALHRVVSMVIPKYATTWHFKGVIIIGAVGLIAGIIVEVYQRMKAKKQIASEAEPEGE